MRGQRLLEGGAYFKVREVYNIKCQNLAIFFFQNKYETEIFVINKLHISTIYVNINDIFIILLFAY